MGTDDLPGFAILIFRSSLPIFKRRIHRFYAIANSSSRVLHSVCADAQAASGSEADDMFSPLVYSATDDIYVMIRPAKYRNDVRRRSSLHHYLPSWRRRCISTDAQVCSSTPFQQKHGSLPLRNIDVAVPSLLTMIADADERRAEATEHYHSSNLQLQADAAVVSACRSSKAF